MRQVDGVSNAQSKDLPADAARKSMETGAASWKTSRLVLINCARMLSSIGFEFLVRNSG